MPVPPESFSPWLQALAGVADRRRGRFLVVLAGAREWSLDCCLGAPLLDTPDTLWISKADLKDRSCMAPGAAHAVLGSETANVVYDAWSGFHPNGFGGLAGTLRGGGLMLLLTPELSAWPGYQDPDYQRMAVEGFAAPPHRLFLQYLGETLQRDSHGVLVRQGGGLPALPDARDAPAAELADSICRSRDQLAAVEAIEQVVRGHRDRPLVLRSDRGRGKSAALGIAAARLLQGELETVILTAPLASNVAAVMRHAAQLLEGSRRQDNTLLWCDRRLQYTPPDELLRLLPPARLLLVDEAAGIPLPLLSRMLSHYHRVVFTTTVHGYEGTGQGFAIRFADELTKRRPQWRSLALRQPIRWAGGDPLEASVNELLLLGAEPASVQGISAAAVDQPQFEWLDRPDLLQSPKRLSQVVGLLVNAHYRTSPDDLRILLDAPNIRILVAASADAVAAVAMVAAEGDLPTELAAAIRQGQRRPRGHLLPQTLWAHTGNARLLSESCWRVVRIAVHPALQRRGLGQRMLERIQQSAVEHGINYLGSSFACSSGLVSFWQQAGYLPVAMGVRRDASSGSHSLLVLRGLAKDTQATVEQERTRFADRFGAALSASLQQLEPEIVGALLPVLSPSHAALQARDSIDLRDFVSGARRYEHCQFALRKVALALLSAPLSTSGLSELQRRVLIAGVLQQQPAGVLAQRYPLRGKAAVLECLRTAFASYQAAAAGQPVNRSGA